MLSDAFYSLFVSYHSPSRSPKELLLTSWYISAVVSILIAVFSSFLRYLRKSRTTKPEPVKKNEQRQSSKLLVPRLKTAVSSMFGRKKTSESSIDGVSAINTTNPQAKKPLTHSPTNIDRYQSDIDRANAMRQTHLGTSSNGYTPPSNGNQNAKSSNQNRQTGYVPPSGGNTNSNNNSNQITQDKVHSAVGQLEEAERLQQLGNLESALSVSEEALGTLIGYLRQPKKYQTSGISKDVLRSTVEMALSNAESMKATIAAKQQSKPVSPTTQIQQQPKKPQAKASSYVPPSSSPSPQSQKPVRKDSKSKISSAFGKLGLSMSKSQDSQEKKAKKKTSYDSSGSAFASSSANNHALHNSAGASSSSSPPPPARPPARSPTNIKINHEDPLVKMVKNDLYVDASQLQNVSWNDIAGLAQAKQSLQEAAILPLIRPDLFTGLRKPQNILLYGPPGTGKTMLVKAVAKESSSILFVCTASSLTSKWHGEGEKLLKTLFQVARAAAPSILFVDEVDALLSARKSEGEHEASRRFKTEFMTQVDGIASGGDGGGGDGDTSNEAHLLLIACTNCPWDLDAAVLRRFPRRILIDLPDVDTRTALVQHLLQKAGRHSLTTKQIKMLVGRLDGYSGSDISSIASEASFGPLRSLGNLQAIQTANANTIRPISYQDFEVAVDQSTKSTSQELLDKYDQWKRDQSA
mmetsp:Transcript_25852/g.63316  ORF Transcript_25852/g.63316 Transcript_25852/m.63316 type:complete len:693 (-) Transcript_25852:968-3046(-)